MLFNSLEFGVLLVLTYVSWSLARGRSRLVVLLAASCLFYASWSPSYFPLLAYSTLLDFSIGKALGRTQAPGKRKLLLCASLFSQLGILFYFKYIEFFMASLGLMDWSEVPSHQSFHVYGDIPPGLSFYTFQTLSYTLDVYRRRSAPCQSLLDFALYVTFFPQLVAGPIVRSDQFLPQLGRTELPTGRETLQAAELFALGLVQKTVIADNAGLAADAVFAAPGDWTGASIALASILFAIQVYGDFQGYSTMARGLAKLFGYDLPLNFRYPWLAGDPLSYRRGWHITMSNWFRDYVFYPLGGTRGSPVRVALNTMLVWMLFGLWHGAAWTFVLWGAYNGLIQAGYREMLRRGWTLPEFPGKRVAGCVLNGFILLPSALFFRSSSFGAGFGALGRMLRLAPDGSSAPLGWWLAFAGLLGIHILSYLYYDERVLERLSWPGRIALLAGVTLLVVLAAPESRPFVYFQF